jgi:hypothetical protein
VAGFGWYYVLRTSHSVVIAQVADDGNKIIGRLCGRLFGEEFEVDGVGHGFVACVGRMEVVAGVGEGGEGGWVGGVLGGFVEVDEAVELTGGPDPLVDGLTYGFACGRGVSGAYVRSEGCAVDLDAVEVGTLG